MNSSSAFFKEGNNKVQQALLFRATKNQSRLYLLGTNHRLPISVLPPLVTDCMGKSKVLCCERIGISSDELNKLLELKPFDESNSNQWYDFITEDAKQIINKYLIPSIEKRFPGKSAKSLKDEWVIAELKVALTLNAMDITIRNMFEKDNKLRFALDRPISKENWITLRDYTAVKFDIDNANKFSEAICDECKSDSLISNYMTASLEDQLETLELAASLAPKQLGEMRNVDWIVKLEEITNQHDELFVAVGCNHLTGESGLLHWLQESGYLLEVTNSKDEFKPFHYNPRQDTGCSIS